MNHEFKRTGISDTKLEDSVPVKIKILLGIAGKYL